MPDPIVVDGASLGLEEFDAVARRGGSCVLAAHARAAVDVGRATLRRVLDAGDAVYGVNTGFGDLAGGPHRRGPGRGAATAADPEPCRGARRAARRRSGARDAGASREYPRPRILRGAAGGHRSADRPARCRGAAGRAEPGLGRRQRRPRSAGPPGAASARVRTGSDRWPDQERGGRAAPRRAGSSGAGIERRARPHQRYPGHDLAACAVMPGCAPPGADRGPRRGALHRRVARHRHRVRPAACTRCAGIADSTPRLRTCGR